MLPVGGSKLGAYQVHSEMGLLILILAILRMVWRLMIPGPVNDADFQGLQTKIANVTKYIFYICFFGLPLSGWAMWSSVAEPGPLSVAGIIPWPQLPFFDLPVRSIAKPCHKPFGGGAARVLGRDRGIEPAGQRQRFQQPRVIAARRLGPQRPEAARMIDTRAQIRARPAALGRLQHQPADARIHQILVQRGLVLEIDLRSPP